MNNSGTQTIALRYQNRLAGLSSQVGSRNAGLLGIASLGIMAGLSHQSIEADIIRAGGEPRLTVAEVRHAINRAAADTRPLAEVDGKARPFMHPRPQPARSRGDASFVSRMIACGCRGTLQSLMASSPLPVPRKHKDQTDLFLATRYSPEELLFCGAWKETGKIGENIRTASQWRERFAATSIEPPETFIVNPLTGAEGRSQEGKPSFRCAETVAAWRYLLLEFDQMSLADQLRFWSGVIETGSLPVRSITFSGGKSLHGIVEFPPGFTAEQWRAGVDRVLSTVCSPRAPQEQRADQACKNPDRLSRIPGAWRVDKGRRQFLLWLADSANQ